MRERSGARRTARATAVGVLAIVLWSALALLTTATRGLPPFELLALSFAVACAAGLALLAARGPAALRRLIVPWPCWALGFGALFAYHALYFVALKRAPPAQASLIAYLWPLLIVLLAAFLPGEQLRARHLAGAALGLAGTALLVLRDGSPAVAGQSGAGYAAALGCAFVWSGYSVLNRRFADQPSEALVGICGAVALAGLLVHLAAERWVAPAPGQAAAIVALGLGPVGLAFLAWDHATKHGRLGLLGTLAYLAPLLSTLLLVGSGRSAASASIVVAALLIVGGAVVASGLQRR